MAVAPRRPETRKRQWEIGAVLVLALLVSGLGAWFFREKSLSDALERELFHQLPEEKRVLDLVRQGANLRRRSTGGATPLMGIAVYGNVSCLEAMLQRGARVNDRDAEGTTPLICAAMSANPRAVEILLAHGAEIDAQNQQGRTALSYAVENGNLRMTRALLARGADPGLRDAKGRSPLALALQQARRDGNRYGIDPILAALRQTR